jgi:hypothetical protein
MGSGTGDGHESRDARALGPALHMQMTYSASCAVLPGFGDERVSG